LIALRVRPSSSAAVDWVFSIQSAKAVLERVPFVLLKSLASRGLAIIDAVANLGARGEGTTSTAPIDIDFSAFLEMLGGPAEFDGAALPSTTSSALPVPYACLRASFATFVLTFASSSSQRSGMMLSDLDFPTTQLFNWFSASGPPSPSAYH
jgi:hypothetical protein